MTIINNHVFLHRTRDRKTRQRDAETSDPCWEGFEQRGTKEKNGRTVPNCVTEDADVDFGAIVRRLTPGASSTERARIEAYVRGKATREGRPGEVDAVAAVSEYHSDNPIRPGRTRDVGLAENIWNGNKYVKLEARETGGVYPNIKFEVAIGTRVFAKGLSFAEAQTKMAQVKKEESKPVPKTTRQPKSGGYQSEMSVFFPRTRR